MVTLYHKSVKGPPSRDPSAHHHSSYLETYNHIRKKHSPPSPVNNALPSAISSAVQWSLQRAENLTPPRFGIDTLYPSLQFVFLAPCDTQGSPATLDLYPPQLALNSEEEGRRETWLQWPISPHGPHLAPAAPTEPLHTRSVRAPLSCRVARPAALVPGRALSHTGGA